MTYINQSMSLRAFEAFKSGEAPLTDWKKESIIECLEDSNCYSKSEIEQISKYSLKVLKDIFLKCSSWHHMGKYYNKVDFYAIEIPAVNFEILEKMLESAKSLNSEKAKAKEETKKVYVTFEENISKYRNYPNFQKFKKYAIQKGNWFFFEDGSKKKADGKHILKVEEFPKAPKGTAEIFKRIAKNSKK